MGYYVRAFCARDDVPSLRAALAFARERGAGLDLEPDSPPVDLDARDWEKADLTCEESGHGISIEINRDDGSEDSLVREEVQEFLEWLDDVPDSAARHTVISHLRATRLIVAAQLIGLADDARCEAAWQILSFCADHCGGMRQADAEGFYDGDRLIVKL